tara:strand:- start:47 stop:460 length:414 start_codon:yes stop_codon:yes gene_type:complete
MSKERVTGLILFGFLLMVFWINFLNYEGIESITDYQNEQNEIAESFQNRFFYDDKSLIDDSKWIIQIAAYENIEESLKIARSIEKAGYKPYITKRQISEKTIYRIRISAEGNEEEIEDKITEIINMGFEPSIIRARK